MSYLIIKFIHIAAAIIWIGSTLTITIFNISMAKKQDLAGITSLSKQLKIWNKFVFGPSAFITLLTGITLSELYGFGWTLWIIWGFSAIILTFILDGLFMGKAGRKLVDVSASDPVDNQLLQSLRRKLTVFGSITILLLFSAVFVMVYKPTF